ncbi:MAG: HNH endonuclease signature motif containing protein, partial [Actinomycetota bacterium]|nr:HNH endonuclease signature motif containing protein [Actinomycetota bacterium]
PIVLGGDSQPLDVGRGRRTVTDTQRRALVAKDGGCVRENCNAPPSQCHAHPIHHWTDGGPTDLDNLALLCHLHHTHIHQTGWTLTHIGNRWVLTDTPDAGHGGNASVSELFRRTG